MQPRRTRAVDLTSMVMVLMLLMTTVFAVAANATEDEEEEIGPFFGERNIPRLCQAEMDAKLEDGSTNPDYWLDDSPTAVCHHMRTGMNGLDAPEIDVLVLVPVSPTAERDMRIMRQAIEMWEGGIEQVAQQLELEWLAQGVNFHITVDAVDVAGGNGGEFTTYPIVDPEIVVVATNPVGGIGIGIDAQDFIGEFTPVPSEGACHGLANPFDMAAWEDLPGFNSHHEERSGTYVEDCGGAGGNICVAVNGAIDPIPGQTDIFGLFDLVSHEVGHCLTIGHVGDGAEGDWAEVPTNDIMAYDPDPPGLTKCVSSLDVEGFAVSMSRYLDVDGDGAVTEADHLQANDQVGDGDAFQTHRPEDHFYASTTGAPTDCPQPDLGLTPGPRTDWSPERVEEDPSSD